MTNDLLRQRRNLLIMSIGLLLFDFAHMSVAKVSILGTELLVGDAAMLKIFAWAMWAYFLLRYYQYLKAERVHGVKPDVHNFLYSKALGYSLKETGMTSPIGIDITNNGTRWSYSAEHGTVSIPFDAEPVVDAASLSRCGRAHAESHRPPSTIRARHRNPVGHRRPDDLVAGRITPSAARKQPLSPRSGAP